MVWIYDNCSNDKVGESTGYVLVSSLAFLFLALGVCVKYVVFTKKHFVVKQLGLLYYYIIGCNTFPICHTNSEFE